jgi:bacterial/archaeal transporter family-2 protein
MERRAEVDSRPVLIQEVRMSTATIAIPLLLVVGGLLAVQAAANVQLATAMGNPMAASTLQLAIATTVLLLGAIAVGTIGALHLVPGVTPWHLVGGLASALYITAGIMLFPRLGAVVTVGLFITGQMIASLVIDGAGLLGVETKHLSVVTFVGLAAVLVGAFVIVRAQGGVAQLQKAASENRLPWMVFALIAGAGLPIQGAINAQLRLDLNAPITVAAFSFIVATTSMALVLIVRQATSTAPAPKVAPLRQVPWWGWVGGFVGASYVTSVFLLIPVIGTAPTVALTVAGQQVASLIVDRYGLLRLPKREITLVRLGGVALLLIGVVLLLLIG